MDHRARPDLGTYLDDQACACRQRLITSAILGTSRLEGAPRNDVNPNSEEFLKILEQADGASMAGTSGHARDCLIAQDTTGGLS